MEFFVLYLWMISGNIVLLLCVVGGKGIELLNKKLDEYLKEDVPATK